MRLFVYAVYEMTWDEFLAVKESNPQPLLLHRSASRHAAGDIVGTVTGYRFRVLNVRPTTTGTTAPIDYLLCVEVIERPTTN